MNQPNNHLVHIYGSALIYLQQNEQGIHVYKKLLQKSETENDINFIAIAINSLAQCYLNLGEKDEAIVLVEKFKTKYLDKGNETDFIHNSSELEGFIYLYFATYGFVMYEAVKDYGTSLTYLIKALLSCPKESYIHYFQILNHFGYCLYEKNKHNISKKNSEIIEAIGYHKWVINLYDNNLQHYSNRLPLTAAYCALAKIYKKLDKDIFNRYYMKCRRLNKRYGYDFFNRDLDALE